jgi:G3E family GTPase
VDLIDSQEKLASLEASIREINSLAPIYKTSYSNIDYKLLLDTKAFDLNNLSEDYRQRLLGNQRTPSVLHDTSVGAVVLLGKGTTTQDKFEAWMKDRLQGRSDKIYRIKGLLNFEGHDEQFVLQGVHDHFSINPHPSNKKWDPSEPRLLKVVFIGSGLDKEEFNKSFKEALHVDSFWM